MCQERNSGGEIEFNKEFVERSTAGIANTPTGLFAITRVLPVCYPCHLSLSLALALKLRRIARLVLQYLLFSVAVEEEDGDDTNTIDDSVPVVVHKGV